MRTLIFLLASLLPLSAQETMIREVADPLTDTHVEVLALFTQPSLGGFFPVRVKIANNLKSDRTIRLDFTSSISYDNRIRCNSTFQFTAPAGKAVTRDIMVPLCSGNNSSSYGYGSGITCNLSGSLGNASNTISGQTIAERPAVLLSEKLHTVNASKLDNRAKTHSGGSSYGSPVFSGRFDPKQLPSDWLAFSGYDSVIMTDTDWGNVPAGGRNAILSWLNMGGQLIIYASSNSNHAMLGIPEKPGYGNCVIKSIRPDLTLNENETVQLVYSNNPVPTLRASFVNDFASTWPLQGVFGGKSFHYAIFILVLVIFAIVVGPVNLFVFAKSGMRHRLFITTPLISLAASLLLMVLIIFQDGFGGSGMRRVLMEVRPDAGQNAAFIHQEQISRTGILTSGGFKVDPACMMVQVPIATSRWARFTNHHESKGAFHLQTTGGKMEGSGDWWQSRSEQGQMLRAVTPTRGRIEATATQGEFVSTFDFPIQSFYFLDASKQWQHATKIETGKPFKVTPVDATMAEPALAEEVNGFTSRNRTLLNRAKNRPGHFIALTNKASGIDTLAGIDWKETQTVITGPVVTP